MTKADVCRHLGRDAKFSYDPPTPAWPLPSVWLGVSAEDQQRAEERIPHLLETPASVRFVSAEPLLGPIKLDSIEIPRRWGTALLNAFTREIRDHHGGALTAARPGGLDWTVAGSESGRCARPCDLAWIRSLRDQCSGSGVPFFWKQHAVNGRKIPMPELDGRRWVEMPSTETGRTV